VLDGGWRLLRHCFALRLKSFFPLIQLKRPKLAVLRQLVFLAVFMWEKMISLRRAADAVAQQPPASSGYPAYHLCCYYILAYVFICNELIVTFIGNAC